MLDIKYIAEHPEEVRTALLKRLDPSEFDLGVILDKYSWYKKKLIAFEEKRALQKKRNDEVANMEKNGEAFKVAVEELKIFANEAKQIEGEMVKIRKEYEDMLAALPNLPDEDVPVGGKEANQVIKEWGDEPKFDFEPADHLTLGGDLGILDFVRASKVSGTQFAMYVGDGALLEWALVNYFISVHAKDGYTCIIPPHLLNEQSAFVAGQLPKFKDDVYWTLDGQCLLPTAETVLVNIHRDETLSEEELPKRYFSYTPCYRREAGTYGKSDRGLMRMHQFNKVEMFQYTTAEGSDAALDELIAKAEKLAQDLGVRYRLSKLATRDISFAMAKTIDIEVWLPWQKSWTEIGSLSNARDFQARRGNMRYRANDGNVKYVHTLNASGLATSRLMVALLETYQNADGTIRIPDVLQSYVGKKVISK
jgi:seryl-tRNA synthetase